MSLILQVEISKQRKYLYRGWQHRPLIPALGRWMVDSQADLDYIGKTLSQRETKQKGFNVWVECAPLFPALGRQKQADLFGFKVYSLVYRASSRTARAVTEKS